MRFSKIFLFLTKYSKVVLCNSAILGRKLLLEITGSHGLFFNSTGSLNFPHAVQELKMFFKDGLCCNETEELRDLEVLRRLTGIIFLKISISSNVTIKS